VPDGVIAAGLKKYVEILFPSAEDALLIAK